MKALLLLFLTVSLPAITYAAEAVDTVTQQEVVHLLDYLKNSGCEFYRNGSWHDAKAASDHLNSKYQYILGKKSAFGTEDFIKQAASASSVTGTPYQVKCANGNAVSSAEWLTAELARYRQNSH